MSKNRISELLAPDDPRHGTNNGYGNFGCRCDRCRDAYRIHYREHPRRLQPTLPDPDAHWRPVLGYEGKYEVSDTGRIWSHLRTGRELKTALLKTGYRTVTLCFDRAVSTRSLHSLVCEAFHGPRPSPEYEVRHLNGNPADNRAENLAWGTKAENAQDRLRHGTDGMASKTHCKWGHEFTPDNINTRAYKKGRWCRQCEDRRTRQFIQRVSQERAAARAVRATA